jgi:hypothetical protein
MTAKRSLSAPSAPGESPADDRAAATHRGLLAKVHIAKKDLGLSDDDYRALLDRRYGVASSKALGAAKLEDLIGYFISLGWTPKRKPKAQATKRRAAVPDDDPWFGKARALWISLYWLGVVRDRSDTALVAFARRQTGIDAATWISDWRPVIEPLKDWAVREAGVTWAAYAVLRHGVSCQEEYPRRRVLEAQARILGITEAEGYVAAMFGQPRRSGWSKLTAAQFDEAIRALGRRVRAAKGMPA